MVVIAACGAVSGGLARTGGVSTSGAPSIFPVRFWRGAAVAGRRRGYRGVSVLRSRAMELVEDKDVNEGCVLVGRRREELASSMEAVDKKAQPSQSLLNVRSGEELLSYIRKEAEIGKLPLNLAAGMEELYYNYRNAVRTSGIPSAEEIILSNMAVTLDRILLDIEDPFIFPPHHKAAREPFDYYMFGQNYIRPLINFRKSYIGNISLFYEVEEKLRQGHNVILISNHQTEADPAIISLLLETTNPYIAEETIYIAGDRVVTDPLCKPFSMGRNLLCVYSKKHLYDTPELADMKKMANTRSLKELAKLLRLGGQIIWIAPSGGRDRPDPITGEWYPAPFDKSAVDNMRRLTDNTGIPGHIYPLALHCHDVMPPPPQVEKEIGERRKICFHGVGMSLGPEVSYEKTSACFRIPEEAVAAFSEALYCSVTEHYNVLRTAINGHNGSNDSNSTVSLSQPWD